jgi:hypothetical protein
MGMAVREVRHGYLLRVTSTHPQHIGQPEVLKRKAAPVGYGGIGQKFEAMAHRSAKLNEPLANTEALEHYERIAVARRKYASRAFSEVITIAPTQAT